MGVRMAAAMVALKVLKVEMKAVEKAVGSMKLVSWLVGEIMGAEWVMIRE